MFHGALTNLCFLVTFLGGTALGGVNNQFGDSITVRIHIPKVSFLVGEHVPIDIYLVNQAGRTLLVDADWSSAQYLRLECRDSEQHLVRPFVRRFETRTPVKSTRQLLANDSLWWSQDLAFEFGSPVASGTLLHSQPAGIYSVVAVSAPEISSNECSYEVAGPSGTEAAVFGRLKELGLRYNIQTVVAEVSSLEELLRLNPNSVYAAQILSVLRYTHNSIRITDNTKVLQYGRRLVEEYPDSYEVESALDDILSVLSRDAGSAYLAEVESTKTGTRAARAARVLSKGVRPLSGSSGGGE